MDEATDIWRQLSGKTGGYQQPAKSHGKKPDRRGSQPPAQNKTRQPRASERASMAAQDWYDRGASFGFSFPYDVNYFALALQRKVEADPRMSPLLADGDKVDRWLAKMNANWWGTADSEGGGGYVDGTITASNAKEMFLGEDWNDVRDYAHTNLRKDYLLKHGKRVKPAVDPNSQEYRGRLEDLRRAATVRQHLQHVEEAGDRPVLDESARGRLRSFANRRRRTK